MRKLSVSLACIVLSFSISIYGEEPDYRKMRLDFAAQPGYDASRVRDTELQGVRKAMAAWEKGVPLTTIVTLEQLVKAIPVSIEAHRRLADAYKTLISISNDFEPARQMQLRQWEKEHRQLANGLVKSILDSGDGKSAETAYKVISIGEEHTTLFYLGLRKVRQALRQNATGTFDVITTVDRDDKEIQVFFDIGIFFGKRQIEHPSQ